MSEPRIVNENGHVFIHFNGMKIPVLQAQRFKIGGADDLLLKAAGKKNLKADEPTLLDLTAGLARDAFHFAALGFDVIALERNTFIHSALVEAQKQAQIERISFVNTEALAYLEALTSRPQVVYYDPMFPDKVKSAAPGKESQLLQALAQGDGACDESKVAERALQCALNRLVIKRPMPAAEILPNPNMSFKGKAVRYDVYLAKP